jgi:mycothiol synthase
VAVTARATSRLAAHRGWNDGRVTERAPLEKPADPFPDLPDGYAARWPAPRDMAALVALVDTRRALAPEHGPVDPEQVRIEVVGLGSWTRRQVVVEDARGDLVAWASVHDRAAGRCDLRIVVAPHDRGADALAAALFDWTVVVARAIAAERDVAAIRLELLLDTGDAQLRGWAADAGHHRARTWLNMARPVAADETEPDLRPGVVVRRVRVHDLGDGTTMPWAPDLQTVHRMLEESFEDHFNSYRESFPEFVQRLREDPGHRWDHWWLAFVEDDGQLLPGGALVSTRLPPDASGRPGSYVDYIGVHRRSRGRGVAKALLTTVIADAAERGRSRVGLEVDADSPTGADGLYSSMGWVTAYTTESWHRDL